MGWIVPISLLTAITDTRMVLFLVASAISRRIHHSTWPHANPRDLEILALEPFQRRQHAMVFEQGGHGVVAVPPQLVGGALQGEVVRVGASAGEDDLRRTGPDSVRHAVAGVLDRLLGTPAGAMDRRRVAEVVLQERHHRFSDLWEDRRGCGVIR